MKYQNINDTEYVMGENKISLIDNNIIHVVAKGEQTLDDALCYKEMCETLSSLVDGQINYLIDLNDCGKSAPEARNIWKEMSEESNTSKVGLFGLNPVARVIASFVIGTYKHSNMMFFKTKEEALAWITK